MDWSPEDALNTVLSFPGKKVALVTGTLNSLALLSLLWNVEDITILYIDAWIDFPWLRTYLLSRVPQHPVGVVRTLRPPYLFFTYVLERGYPPPHSSFRWHTRRVRVEPFRDFMSQGGYTVAILDSSLSTLPEDKRLSIFPTLKNGVGIARQRGTNHALLFPLAGASLSDLVSLARESNPPFIVALLSRAPRANCWLCDFPDSEEHARTAARLDLFGARDLQRLRERVLMGSRRPENRVVDEHGYPRYLTRDFRRKVYVWYQTFSTRLNHRVPGYLPSLPPAEVFGL